MTALASAVSILDQAGQSLGGFIPRLGGAIVLLVVGLLVARLLGWAARRGLTAIGVDRLAERLRVRPVLERAGLGPSLARVLGRIVWVVVSIVVVFAALSLLGLQSSPSW
jgi:Conserved TM helix